MSSLRLVPVSGQPIEVEKEPSMVGRDPSCEIVVTDGSVSRRHARLERRGPAWWVVDQGSANGTYLNSQRIAEQALKAGQELRFGALAFRVEIAEDPEATVATPLLEERGAPTLLAATPDEIEPPRPAAPPPRPAAPPPPPPARVAAAPAAPVGQMAGGPPPAKKGRSPIFWVLTGCCGCIVVVALLVGVIAGGAFMASRPAATAAQTWLAEVRQNQVEAAAAGLSTAYKARLDDAQFQAIATVVQQSKDATFMSRSIDNDRATLKGVLTGGAPQPITIVLVKEDGAWKVDDVRLGVE
jgi:hypothetical protein